MNSYSTIGVRLADLRRKANLTISDLASRAGIKDVTLQNFGKINFQKMLLGINVQKKS